MADHGVPAVVNHSTTVLVLASESKAHARSKTAAKPRKPRHVAPVPESQATSSTSSRSSSPEHHHIPSIVATHSPSSRAVKRAKTHHHQLSED